MKKLKITFLSVNLFWLLNCSFYIDSPFVLENIRCEIGEKDNVCRFAGVFFSFFNATEKAISKIGVSFSVFNQDGTRPFYNNSNIKAELLCEVLPQQKIEVCACIDSKVSLVPEENYIVGNFRVDKIIYSDGSIWENYSLLEEIR